MWNAKASCLWSCFVYLLIKSKTKAISNEQCHWNQQAMQSMISVWLVTVSSFSLIMSIMIKFCQRMYMCVCQMMRNKRDNSDSSIFNGNEDYAYTFLRISISQNEKYFDHSYNFFLHTSYTCICWVEFSYMFESFMSFE